MCPSHDRRPLQMADKKTSKYQTSVYLWFLQVAVLLGLTSLLIWASLTPKTPIFAISNLQFQPHQNDTTFSRNSSAAFNVTISNPNKRFGVFFDDVNITLHCKNDVVGFKSIPGFYLGHKTTDLEEVKLGVNGHDSGELSTGWRVGLETRVRYKILRYETKHRRLGFEHYVHFGPHG